MITDSTLIFSSQYCPSTVWPSLAHTGEPLPSEKIATLFAPCATTPMNLIGIGSDDG